LYLFLRLIKNQTSRIISVIPARPPTIGPAIHARSGWVTDGKLELEAEAEADADADANALLDSCTVELVTVGTVVVL
jgi:hypothetical protein